MSAVEKGIVDDGHEREDVDRRALKGERPVQVTENENGPARMRIFRRRIFFLVSLVIGLALVLGPWHQEHRQLKSVPPAKTPHSHPTETLTTGGKRVAIIGAGASGCSAAFFLARAAAEAQGSNVQGGLIDEIVVYESNSFIGGRSTTVYPHNDTLLRPIELGASIFHFNLSTNTFELGDGESGSTGIWDGSQFLFRTAPSSSYFSSIRTGAAALWRYGLSSWRTDKAVATMLKDFANLYDRTWLSTHGASKSIEDWAERSDLGVAYTTARGWEWAVDRVRASTKWAGEIIEASTRVNYASNLKEIHALGAAVSMATDDAKQVTGGNWQMFAHMLNASGATVKLNTKVTDIELLHAADGDRFAVIADGEQLYDQVFFAAPWHLSPVAKSLEANMTERIPHQRYIHLHVTLVTTTRPHFDPAFFGLAPGSIPPTTVLTTSVSSEESHTAAPTFLSANYQGKSRLDVVADAPVEYVVKNFSLESLSDYFLNSLFGEKPTWVLRKEWDSYPALRPSATYAPVEPVEGFQYLAAMEPWVSTMETQTLSAREAVGRVVNRWWGLGMGQCGGADGRGWDWTCWD